MAKKRKTKKRLFGMAVRQDQTIATSYAMSSNVLGVHNARRGGKAYLRRRSRRRGRRLDAFGSLKSAAKKLKKL